MASRTSAAKVVRVGQVVGHGQPRTMRRRVALVVMAVVAATVPGVLGASPAVAAAAFPGAWSAVPSMSSPRIDHTATLLSDGRVLVVGGRSAGEALRTVEIFNPATNGWTTAAPMEYSRFSHTATLLHNGEVLVVGGMGRTSSETEDNYLDSAEIYNPATNLWRPTGSLGVALAIRAGEVFRRARSNHAAALLPSGKVLVAGGKFTTSCQGGINCYGEVFDPNAVDAATGRLGTWRPTGSMVVSRDDAFISATPLAPGPPSSCGANCGKVLVVGSSSTTPELFDPTATDPATGYVGTWVATAPTTADPIPLPHKAVLLPNGKVLVDGFRGNITIPAPGLTHSEIFDPYTGTWSYEAHKVATRDDATVLGDGKVLTTGWLYDPVSLVETGGAVLSPIAAGPMVLARHDHTATLMPDGRVLVAGGDTGDSGTAITNTAEVYTTLPFLSVSDAAVAEGTPNAIGHTQGYARFKVSLSQPANTNVTVFYRTADGTAKTRSDYPATTDSDYQATAGSVTFAVGETTKQVSVPVIMDSSATEEHEKFFLDLSTASAAVFVTDGRGQATIFNDEPATIPTLSVNDVVVTEGPSNTTTTAIFTVSLSRPSAAPVSVKAVTIGGTAHAAPHSANDFIGFNQTLNFARDETAKQVAVTVNGDDMEEANEVFFLQLDAPSGAVADKRVGTTTIDNDDNITVSVNDVALNEGPAGTNAQAAFTISLSGPAYRQVTANYATSDATTRSSSSASLGPADYTPASGSVTFAPGETTKTVVVSVNGDDAFEPDETFLVQLSGATVVAVDRAGRGTIRNDDAIPL